MFKELFNFKYKRSKKEAFGFYIFYLITGIILGGIAGAFMAVLNYKAGVQAQASIGYQAGSVTSVIFCSVLGLTVLISKRLYTLPWCVMLALLTVLCSFLGALLGCICPAILTTFEVKEKINDDSDLRE